MYIILAAFAPTNPGFTQNQNHRHHQFHLKPKMLHAFANFENIGRTLHCIRSSLFEVFIPPAFQAGENWFGFEKRGTRVVGMDGRKEEVEEEDVEG